MQVRGRECVVGKKKKPSAMKRAIELRAQYRTWLFRMIVGLVICAVVLVVYWFLSVNAILTDVGLIPWLAALVAAGVIGFFSNRFSKAHREYEAFLDTQNLTDFDVREYLKSN